MKTVILDCGHGGLLNGRYTTGNKKMYKFPNGEIAYEGVINRKFGERISDFLLEMGVKVKFTVDPTDPTDIPLWKRVAIANKTKNSIFVSIHCNAFNSRANGTEIFTTKGETMSDVLADDIILEVNKRCPELKMRWDLSDGDYDKESQFYVLRKTRSEAVLLECLFFDHYDSYLLTKDDEFVDKFCKAVAVGIYKYIK